MLNNNSLMSRIIEFRTYEKPIQNAKTLEARIHKERMKLKQEYSLPQRDEHLNRSFEKMWSYLSQKTSGGGSNE